MGTVLKKSLPPQLLPPAKVRNRMLLIVALIVTLWFAVSLPLGIIVGKHLSGRAPRPVTTPRRTSALRAPSPSLVASSR